MLLCESGPWRNNELPSLKYTDLGKCMEQWLQLLNFFFSRWPLPHLSSHICLSASLHIPWSQTIPVSLDGLLANEQGFFSYSSGLKREPQEELKMIEIEIII